MFTPDNTHEKPKLILEEIEYIGPEKDTLLPNENWRDSGAKVYMPETVEFYKYAKGNGCVFKIIPDVKYADLRDHNIWMPIIWAAQEIAIPIILGVISNYVYDKFKKKEEAEKCTLHVEIRTPGKKGKTKSIKYDGSVKGLEEIRKIHEAN